MIAKSSSFLIILSAPSGGGKSTILTEIMQQRDNIDYSVSYTTRAPRGEEQNGIHYHFVAETESCIYMIETKAKGDVESAEVQAKAEAASQWCKNASDYSTGVGGKSWKYLLVPHDVVDDSKRLIDFLQHQKM